LVYRIDYRLAFLDLTDGTMDADFGIARHSWAIPMSLHSMLVTIDGGYLFTSNGQSGL
jgi:hypothetical protein